MSNTVEVVLFLFLILAPCALAVLVTHQPDRPFKHEVYAGWWHLPLPRGFAAPTLRTAWPESQPTDQFKIRSFPKGLRHRRSLGLTLILDPAASITSQASVLAPVIAASPVEQPAIQASPLVKRPVDAIEEFLPIQVESQVESQLRAHLEAYVTSQMKQKFLMETREQHRAEIEQEIRAEIEEEMQARAAIAKAAAMEAFVRSQNTALLNRELEKLASDKSRAA